MSFNQTKVINVYYNKGDRKPYDVDGKPLTYIGEEFIGATEATKLRFYLGEDLGASVATVVIKRADGERRLDICDKGGSGTGTYYEITLNQWHSAVGGKAIVIFKAYNGTVVFDDNENPTQIVSVTGRIIVSDNFGLYISYAPVATLTVPPDDTPEYEQWFIAIASLLEEIEELKARVEALENA